MSVVSAEANQGADEEARQIDRLLLLDKMKLGPIGYYAALVDDSDDILAIGAAKTLLDQNAAPESIWDRIVALSGYPSIQSRAYDFFLANFDYERARAALETPPRAADQLIKRQIAATFAIDPLEAFEIDIERFHQTGEAQALANAASAAETVGGWKRALPLIVDLILVIPQNARWAMRLRRTLREANRLDLLKRFCEIVDRIGIFPDVSMIFRATIASASGAAEEALKLLDRIDAKKVSESDFATVGLRAEILEKLGRFDDAYRAYVRQNELLRPKHFNPRLYAERVLAKGAVKIGSMAPDERKSDFVMLGFPRSGTTLLENALAAHPRVETFEEIPSFNALNHCFRPAHLQGKPLDPGFVAQARARYYREIDRRKRKAGADIFIDKLPIMSAEAKFLHKLFPQKRYIFSIRHPYDVVLSCFKQAFASNAAMDNFTSFEDSCRVYDFAMSQWFGEFNLESPEVCYVRYDRLVMNLKSEVSRALTFLGADWDDGILNFAERAGEREARTPSYAKVRAGLTMGVQSSWRNYGFLFKNKEARLLDRWVKHFGYEVD